MNGIAAMREKAAFFTDETDIVFLPGGQKESFRAGGFVLKPVHENEMYEWLSGELESIESPGIDIAKPVKSKNGAYIEAGYGATGYRPCSFFQNRIAEKLNAARAFHSLVAHIDKPVDFQKWTSPWTLSNMVAWGHLPLPEEFHARAFSFLSSLIRLREIIDLPFQFIHSDLAGNILFDGDTPVIIDISPAFYPVEYAQTLLVTDSIAWHGEPLESLALLPCPEGLKRQLVLRAVIFRLCVPLFFDYANVSGFLKTCEEFHPLFEFLSLNAPSE